MAGKEKTMNEKQHAAAVKRVGELMDAKLGTPEGAELVRLSDQVIAYEDKHYPIDKPSAATIKRFLVDRMKRASLEMFYTFRPINPCKRM